MQPVCIKILLQIKDVTKVLEQKWEIGNPPSEKIFHYCYEWMKCENSISYEELWQESSL
jgi:hypothetical protein